MSQVVGYVVCDRVTKRILRYLGVTPESMMMNVPALTSDTLVVPVFREPRMEVPDPTRDNYVDPTTGLMSNEPQE